jgi:hypothetical protein
MHSKQQHQQQQQQWSSRSAVLVVNVTAQAWQADTARL